MLRRAIILLLCLGTLLPKASATLAVILPGSFQMIVICTGSEIAVIALSHTGAPVEDVEIHGLDCVADATPVHAHSFDPHWVRLARNHAAARIDASQLASRQDPEDLPSRGRAPPTLASEMIL
ncbi:hypothetical protein [uncultured Tateyamaria sp.]|uniref:hypothetical protein n=1 Tax=uncultured Tateyamaria sp. TaxID=455651 RepID=UPI002608894B|nr:hypothetical protein [uncultured Tateyamaria sp.]